MKTATLGSISSGTLRTEDLLPEFLSTLESLVEGNEHAALIKEAREWCDGLAPEEGSEEETEFDERGSEIVNELQDALNEAAPEFAPFGTLEGDGAEFGFWPSIAQLEFAIVDNEGVVKFSAGDEPSYIMSVNAHGNVTLYRVKLEEVWSVV